MIVRVTGEPFVYKIAGVISGQTGAFAGWSTAGSAVLVCRTTPGS